MGGSIFIIAISLIASSLSFPALAKKKQYNVIVIASLLLVIGIMTTVLNSYDIVLDPSVWLTKLFKPISQIIINLIQA